MIVTQLFNFVHSVTLLISRNENKKCNCKNTTVLHMLDKMLYGHIMFILMARSLAFHRDGISLSESVVFRRFPLPIK